MNPTEYQQLAARTECDQEAAAKRRHYADTESSNPLVATRLNHAVIGLAGEAGELAGAVERWLYYGKGLDLPNVCEELGDSLWYIAFACNALGLSLEGIMQANIEKLRKRYPDKYSDFQAAEENRDRKAEASIVAGVALPVAQGSAFELGDLVFVNTKGQATSFAPASKPAPTPAPTGLVFGRKNEDEKCEGTGKVREPSDYAKAWEAEEDRKWGREYKQRCKVCGARIHQSNTAGLCGDCRAKEKCGTLTTQLDTTAFSAGYDFT